MKIKNDITPEEYIENLKKQDDQYHWPIKNYNKNLPKRIKIHEEFPFVITFAGYYDYFDQIDDWCWEKISQEHGECTYKKCSDGFDAWKYREIFEFELFEKLDLINDEKERHELIQTSFEILKDRSDYPYDHSHKGRWNSLFLMKTGYDFGYIDYCFKYEYDAVYFKLFWY